MARTMAKARTPWLWALREVHTWITQVMSSLSMSATNVMHTARSSR